MSKTPCVLILWNNGFSSDATPGSHLVPVASISENVMEKLLKHQGKSWMEQVAKALGEETWEQLMDEDLGFEENGLLSPEYEIVRVLKYSC